MGLLILVLGLWVGLCRGGSDMDALLEFKEGIREDPSGRVLGSWKRGDSDGCPLDWYGIDCSGMHVSSIKLDGIGLAGNISFSALAGLGMLRNLSISNNRLMGVLLPGVASIGSLEFLDLSGNSFAGSIPVELGGMENLVYLNLSSNNFGGTVPNVFGNLTRLEYLDLRGNGFSGDLKSVIAQLQNPLHIDLSGNRFSGTLESVSENSSIISSLQHLNISHNVLSGKLFAEGLVPEFESLEVFDASFNQFTGSVPIFNFIVSLKVLRLQKNQFSGSLPEALLKESSTVLSELDISCNQLTGPLTIINSATLKNLNLSTNQLAGSLPARVGTCTSVDLSNNKLSGNLSKIQSWGNYVEIIDLSSNMLTGTLPNETSQFLRLVSLKASNNLLAGELPPVIGTYPELISIDLSVNQLYGSLPPSLFTSSRLTILNLSGNSFTGRIPFPKPQGQLPVSSDAFPKTQSPSLASLDLSNNSLSGPLPPEIVALTGLKSLNINRNNISGPIPNEVSILHGLIYLYISNNRFEGNIPDHLPDSLVGFNVSYNNLSGKVPGNLIRFPDSSFHPGNSLLIFPNLPPSNGTDLIQKHGHHKRVAIKYALIVGAIAFAVLILALVILIHRLNNGNRTRKEINQRNSPIPHPFGIQRSKDIPSSMSFSQDQLLQSRSVSMPLEHEDISSDTRESAGPEIQESSASVGLSDNAEISSFPSKHERKSSLALFMSSPRSTDTYSSGHASSISVSSPDKLAGDLHLFDSSFIFTAEALSRAPAEILGRSCHGTSYKATLENGHILTVKWLREGITKGKKEFYREAKKLGNIRHPNIVLLRGHYWGPKQHERLIIADYVDATSLTAHFSEPEPRKLQPLSLNQRLNISIDVARALNYLHNERAIPHGNIKSTNILLQSPNQNAILTDYSLHRIMTPYGMAEQVLNAGALGYSPPEFASTSKPCPSLKSDVYAFGVILLELLTGKNAGEIVSGNPGVVDLTDWVRLLASESRSYQCFDTLIPEVDGASSPPKVLDDMLSIALRCIRSAPERPEIGTIFEDLCSLS